VLRTASLSRRLELHHSPGAYHRPVDR
jgi:hypothetical protein